MALRLLAVGEAADVAREALGATLVGAAGDGAGVELLSYCALGHCTKP
jgi:hypothetical protein